MSLTIEHEEQLAERRLKLDYNSLISSSESTLQTWEGNSERCFKLEIHSVLFRSLDCFRYNPRSRQHQNSRWFGNSQKQKRGGLATYGQDVQG